jgi:hypothetical protein
MSARADLLVIVVALVFGPGCSSSGAHAGADSGGPDAGLGDVGGDGGADVDQGPSADATVPADRADGWLLTVYLTPVEKYHSGPPKQVRGCTSNDCPVAGNEDLGTYPADFVQAVIDHGTGHLTSGPFAGGYLNWTGSVGFWLDDAPRDARGMPLEAYVSAAADPSVPFDTPFRITDCGVDDGNGGPIDATVCDSLMQAHWIVRDRFEVGAVGKHLDLYIGEEDHANFSDDPRYVTAAGAKVVFGM